MVRARVAADGASVWPHFVSDAWLAAVEQSGEWEDERPHTLVLPQLTAP